MRYNVDSSLGPPKHPRPNSNCFDITPSHTCQKCALCLTCALLMGSRASRRLNAEPQTPARKPPRASTNKDSKKVPYVVSLQKKQLLHKRVCKLVVGGKNKSSAESPRGGWVMCRRWQTIPHRYLTDPHSVTSCAFVRHFLHHSAS